MDGGRKLVLRASVPLLRLYRALGFNRVVNADKVLNPLLRYAPRRARRWMQARRWESKVLTGGRLVPETELERHYRSALLFLAKAAGPDALGDYLEFGVFHGASFACMHRALEATGLGRVRLFGFDSFDGLPESADLEDDATWSAGQFAIDEEFTRAFLSQAGVDWTRSTLVKGWFQDTLNAHTLRQYGITQASVIMVDCDLYSSAKQALDFCGPLIRREAIVFFDDWTFNGLADKQMGEKRAFEEFLAENPHFAAEPFGRYGKSEIGDPVSEGAIYRVYRRD